MAEGRGRDERLAAVLDEMALARSRGEEVDVDSWTAREPELAEEIRSLWATAAFADDVARICENANPPTRSAGPESPVDAPPAERTSSRESGSGAPRRAPPLPDRIGDYEILEEIGRGGMGVVYKARQANLERAVALKAIIRGALASEADRSRFDFEARAAARLEHPNIVPVYDVGEHDGQPYFTMRYIRGQTLAQRLAEGPLPPKEAARILASVARAIDYANHHGVVHRDLKPANILIAARDGRPYVTDFGLAKRSGGGDSLTVSGAILGTPSYMSPEQAAGKGAAVSPSSDVYSLGAILYHAITGRPPFQSTSPVNTILQVIEQDPLPPRLLNPQVDRGLEMIALRCLQKPVDMRYASAGELARDLEAYLADEPLAAWSGTFRQVASRMFRETHHAGVLENWGLLWMWHSLVLLLMCLFTNVLHQVGVRYEVRQLQSHVPYIAVWTIGLGTWAAIFWALRHRAGPVTFVERQIAHVWGGSVISVMLLNVAELLMGLDALTLTPVLALVSGTVFFTKAGILSGRFYFQAAAAYLSIVPMALFPDWGLAIFGVVSAVCFFVPGLKYHRQRRSERERVSEAAKEPAQQAN